eukprot:Seg7397.1 transcript_id=Seg7397.1/GoldUCD/mRNA.D3Y31 product="RING finger protein 145" protein_id=Seg7397.1/GoldUCD/D3Y31
MAARRWCDVLLRVPCIFALDFSLSLETNYFGDGWLVSKLIQAACIILSTLLTVSTNDQLFTFYYIGMLIMDLSFVLGLNVLNTVDIFLDASHFGGLLEVPNAAMAISSVILSWLFFLFSIFMYAKAFDSVKPAVLSIVLLPIMFHHATNDGAINPSFSTCICFAVANFIILQTIYSFIWKLKDYLLHQLRLATARLRIYGIFVLTILHWRRLTLHSSLIVYWTIIFNFHFVSLVLFTHARLSYGVMLACIAHTCNTYVKMFACCYVIYFGSKIILYIVRWMFVDDNVLLNETQQRPTGLRETIGFLLLGFYTDLPNINASKRIVLVELIQLLLISALIRSSFEVVEPYLLALHSAPVLSRRKHVIILVFISTLMYMAAYVGLHLYDLRKRLPFSIPNIITIIQIASAFILHLLYMYDSWRIALWEELDDYVYYIKGGCRGLEFILIVGVLGYRITDTSLEWTVFQCIMICLHLYVNVYLPIRDGWQSISHRRLINQRLDALKEVAEQELLDNDDICPICLEELHSARITPCSHIFHKLCLKKWLKIQNRCPLCQSVILNF